MAKDPAFLFYPGDASEDTQFMNRLERGAYFDILKAQKKFGRFTIDQIKKVLGGDFEACWKSLELVLKNENGSYFIEWVNEKIEERKKFSESRRKNRQRRGEQKDTSDEDMNITSTTSDQLVNSVVKHMVDVIEDIIVIENKEGGAGGNGIVVDMVNVYKQKFQQYPIDQERDYKACLSIAYKIADNQNIPRNTVVTKNRNVIRMRWGEIVEFVSKDKWFKGRSISDLDNEWQRLTNTMYANQGNSQQSVSKTINTGGSFGKL